MRCILAAKSELRHLNVRIAVRPRTAFSKCPFLIGSKLRLYQQSREMGSRVCYVFVVYYTYESFVC